MNANRRGVRVRAARPADPLLIDDSPDWRDLADVLEELDLTLTEFHRLHGHVGLDHAGWAGQTMIDIRQLQGGK